MTNFLTLFILSLYCPHVAPGRSSLCPRLVQNPLPISFPCR
jgi:hypothetical protein